MEADLYHADVRADGQKKKHEEATRHFSQFRERAEKKWEQHERFWCEYIKYNTASCQICLPNCYVNICYCCTHVTTHRT